MDKHDTSEKAILGFWIYLMTDLLMFAALFATFAVLRENTFGGPSGKELFSLSFALTETIILLISSFTCGLAMVAARKGSLRQVFLWLGATFFLGMSFLVMEFNEFSHLVSEGNSWQRSAFLSSYFTLIGTHGLHIAAGLLWVLVALVLIGLRGLTPFSISKLTRLALFWHFLDLVWIFIFAIVYLMGAL